MAQGVVGFGELLAIYYCFLGVVKFVARIFLRHVYCDRIC